jgi:hypothetical protein
MTADAFDGNSTKTTRDTLRIYLNDHLVGAAAGVRLADRVAAAHKTQPAGRDLGLIAAQIHEDYDALLAVMRALGVRAHRASTWLGAAGEIAGRFKPTGRISRRTPLTSLVEIEALRLGVLGKLQGWRVLAQFAEHDDRLEAESLAALERKAERQAEVLEPIRLWAAAAALTHGPGEGG